MASEQHSVDHEHIVVRHSQPLIGIITPGDDGDTVTYFTDEAAADAATTDADIEAALALAGAWSDLSWDEVEAGLDRIRHESKPTPPIEL